MGSQWPGSNYQQAPLGATFVPGSNDDYNYNMPVISPRPQRNMPEVTDNIAQNLAHLELEARSPSSLSGLQSPSPAQMHSTPQLGTPGLPGNQSSQRAASPRPELIDEPSFSPFPVLKEKKLNVPPTDEEKESILEGAREPVLSSNDPEMQLAWAQDTLAFVEIAQQSERRLSKTRPPRPSTPRVERQLRTDALSIVDFLAQQHHPKAEFLKGTWLEFGRFGYPLDKREAYRCYSRSAQNGYARSEYRMGMQFESSNEYDKAIQHYNLGVQQGDAASNYRMGMMKLLGQCGQVQDYRQGLNMLKYSADNADENAPQGAYVYGMLYARELKEVSVPEPFLPLNLDKARLNIEKAAYLGFAKAQVRIGSAYELCELNCSFDPVLSLHYSNLAARQGEPEAEMAISKWFLSGYEGIFAKDEGMAFAYAQRAAADGLPTAEFAMGYFYEVGIHVPTSLKEARLWYSKAADHGNKDAAGRIDGISRSKTLSRKDHEKVAMAKINSVRRRGESDATTAPPPLANATIEMPAFPSAQDQYAQSPQQSKPAQPYPTSPAAGGLNQAPPTVSHYNQGHGFPPAGQQPSNSYPNPQPYGSQATPSAGYPQGNIPFSGPNYPQGAVYNSQPYGRGTSHVAALYQQPQQRPAFGPPEGYGNSPHIPAGPYGRPAPQYSHQPRPQVGSHAQSPPVGPGPGNFGGLSPQPHGYRTSSAPPPNLNPQSQYAPTSKPPNQQPSNQFQHQPPRIQQPPDQNTTQQQRPAPSPSPVQGLGFTAPPDLSGADRRKNSQRPDNQNQNPPGRGGYGMPTGSTGSRPTQPSTQNSNPQRPPRGESLSPHLSAKPVQPVPSPKPLPQATSKPLPQAAPQSNKPAASKPSQQAQAAPQRRPGKGPSTFEEMGVPQSKKQEDCILM